MIDIVDLIITPFSDYVFMQRALMGCVILSLAAGPLGVLLILRRMSLMGEAMSHAVLPGIAAGFLIGGLSVPLMGLGGLIAGIIVAVCVGVVTRTTILREDAKNLMATKAISKREYDERASALRIAEGNMKAARGAVDSAKLNLEYTDVIAPISGKVSRAEITEGNTVNAGGNAPVLTRIVALSPIYISFEVDEQTFLSHIQNYTADALKQIPVQVGLANQKDTPIPATIHSFDNQLNVTSGTIRVRAINENADGRLVPGLFARVRIGTPQAEKHLLVSERAIGTDQSKKYVFVVNDKNMAEYHEVTLGSMVDGLRVVRSGLNAGDKVIVNGLMRVRPGAPVQPELVDMQTEKPFEAKPAELKKDEPSVLIPADKEAEKQLPKVEDVTPSTPSPSVDQPKQ